MRRALAAAAAAVALAGCTQQSSPEAELQELSNDVVEAANAGDAAALRTAGGRLLDEVRQQSANGDIPSTKADALRVLTTRILANAGLLEESEQPSPSPSATPSPSPSPKPSPSPEPSPSPSPSPEPEPSEEPSPAEESPPPDVLPTLGVASSAQPAPS